MIHIEDEFFLKKKFNFEKLKEFGFSIENNTYVYTEYFWIQILKLSLKYRMF